MKKFKKLIVASVMAMTVLSMSAVVAPSVSAADAMAGDLIKMAGSSSVYYLADNGKRYVFPNEATYKSWYNDFSGVKTISATELASYPLGGNIVVRPGTKLVKIQTDPTVYAVEANGTLRSIVSEANAIALWGADWAKRVIDVPDSFFVNYTVGTPLTVGAYPAGSLIKTATSADVYYIAADGKARKFANETAVTANGLNLANVVTAASLPTLGTEITGAESAITTTSQSGVTAGPLPGVGTGLTVALASDTPAAGNVPSGATGVAMAKYNFTASTDGPVVINTLVLKKEGLGTTSEVTNVYLYEGANRLTNARSVNSTSKEVTFSNLGFTVPAGTTKSLTVKATLTGTGIHSISLASSSKVTTDGAVVNGSFPMTGNSMSLTTAVTLGSVTVSKYSTLSDVEIGSRNALISKIKLTAANEALNVSQIAITIKGTGGASEVTNLVLKQGTTQLATVAAPSGDLATFAFNTISIAEGASIYLDLYADVAGKNAETITTYLNNDADIVAVGADYGYSASVVRTAFDGTTGNLHSVTLTGGDLTIADNQYKASTYAPGNNDVTFLDMNWTATSAMTVKSLSLVVTAVGGDADGDNGDLIRGDGTEANIKDIKLVNKKTGATISGPVELTVNTTDSLDTAQTLTFADDWELAAGEVMNVIVTADIDNNNPGLAADNDYTIALSATPTVEDTNGTTVTNIVPSAAVTSKTMTVTAPVLTTAVSASPASATVVKGKTGQEAVAMVMSSVGDDITVSSIKLSGYIDADAGGSDTNYGKGADETTTTNYFKNVVTGVQLYKGSVTDANKLGSKVAFSTAGEATVTGINLTVPKDDSVKIIAVADIATSAYLDSNDDKVYITILAPTTDIAAQDSEGTDIAASNAGGDVNSGTVVLTVTNAGTITAALGGSNPSSTLVTAGTSNIDLLQLKFTATRENQEVQKLSILLPASTEDEITELKLTYKDSTGATKTVTKSVTTTTVNFTGLDIYVDKDEDATVMVSATTNTTTAGADSGAVVYATFDFDTNFEAYGADSGTQALSAGTANLVGNSFEVYKTVLTVVGDTTNPSGTGTRASSDLVFALKGTTSNSTNAKLGGSYAGIDDEAATSWTGSGLAVAASATTPIDGTNTLRATEDAASATTDYWYYDTGATSVGLQNYKYVSFWIRSSAAKAAGDLTFNIDDATTMTAATDYDGNVPALSAATWTYVKLTLSGLASTSRYVGFQIAANPDNDATIDVDNIRFFNDSMTLSVGGSLNSTAPIGEDFYLKDSSGVTRAMGYYSGTATAGTVEFIAENGSDITFGNSGTVYSAYTSTLNLMATDTTANENLSVVLSTGTQSTAGGLVWNDNSISALTPIDWVAGPSTIESAQTF